MGVKTKIKTTKNIYSTQENVIDALNEIELFYTNILKIVS